MLRKNTKEEINDNSPDASGTINNDLRLQQEIVSQSDKSSQLLFTHKSGISNVSNSHLASLEQLFHSN